VEWRPPRPRHDQPAAVVARQIAAAGDADIETLLGAAERIADEGEQSERVVANQVGNRGRGKTQETAAVGDGALDAVGSHTRERLVERGAMKEQQAAIGQEVKS